MILLGKPAFAQNSFQYPTPFSQFFNYYSFVNPAATGYEGRALLRAGEQLNAGYFSRVRCFFAQAEASFRSGTKKSFHAFGVTFMNNKEGDLLSFNRTYIQYAYHLAISEEWTVASGVSAGFLNLSIEPTATSRNVSSYAPDGSIGILFYREKEKIGISSAQLPDRYILAINERIPVKRYYRFLYSRTFFLSEGVTFTPSLLYTAKKEKSDLDINGSFVLKKLIRLGGSYRYQRGTSYMVGIDHLKFMGGNTSFTFSYNIPWPSSTLGNIQTFEFVLSYVLPEKND